MALKYAAKPVVAAPFARTLGGGCEIVLHSTRAQASAETYMGLVEVGVGLIPGGGGCKELLLRLKDPRKVFELIGYAKVSSSAEEAKKLGLLDRADSISMNPERLIGDAKALALSLVPRYAPGVPRTDIKVAGEDGFALLKLGAWTMRQGHFISDHDVVIAEKLAQCSERRPADGRTDRFRTISAGSGARSVPEPVRQSENAGAHGVYAEDGQAAEELIIGKIMEAVIIDCLRTAVGKAPKGSLRNTRPDDLAATVIRRLLAKYPSGSRRRKSTT